MIKLDSYIYAFLSFILTSQDIIRNENSAYGSISLTLGIISLVLGYFGTFLMGALYYLMGYVLMFAIPLITVIYGIIGMVKDRNMAMSIVGLNFGIIVWIMIFFDFYMMILPPIPLP